MKAARYITLFAGALSALGATNSAFAVDTYVRGSENDPRLRMARFQGASKQYYSAIATLLEIQREGGKDFEASPEYWEMLASYQLAYGLHDRAEKTYKTVAAAASDPLDEAEAELELARFEYERGYHDLARSSLLRAKESLPRELNNRWKDLYSRVLMAQGRYNEAIEILEDVEGSVQDEMFMQFNLGVALINDGQFPKGRSLLDRVGRAGGDEDIERNLRDRANVTLGWHFLQQQLGGSAKPILMRVRSKGPYTNRALLGLGWAELAPEGKRQLRANAIEGPGGYLDDGSQYGSLGVLLRRGYLEDPYDRAGIRGFRKSNISDEQSDSLRRALVPWVELLDRDPQDPAVQEAWLAVPFALDRLGAHTQAVKYYEQAAERLEQAYKRTLRGMRSIRGGRMVETIMQSEGDKESGWAWELRELPDAPETYYLQTLLAEHRFAEALKQYRDLRQISSSLNTLRGQVGKISAASNSGSSRPSIDASLLIAKARLNWTPIEVKANTPLRQAKGLAQPGAYTAPISKVTSRVMGLKLSAMPDSFDGTFENLDGLAARSQSLAEPIKAASQQAAARLRKMATDELEAQKQKIDKYLVETRFSLARLYDSALPDEDQDEFEIDEQGNPIRQLRLESGEYEIDKDEPIEQQLQKRRAPPTERIDEEYEVK
tara:strand:- start:15220 stop:17205 length:1986 start_codon:yes stop_codon:yes gene_type:complete